ncbi:MAG: ribonuclease Z [Saprospiraceae bacterium]
MDFSFTSLGVSAAQPAYGRHLAAHVLCIEPELFLIDCGEGAQYQLNAFGVKRHRIRHIFISHLHGDHFFGLIGLLTSMGMNDRTEPLSIHATAGLEEMIGLQLRLTGSVLPFDITYHPLTFSGMNRILETKRLEVFSFPLDHRTPACGFLFREKPLPLNILPEKIAEYGLSFEQIRAVKSGSDLELPGGELIPNQELTLPPYKPRSFAYCSDTAYSEAIVPFIRGVDLLYHESTFLDRDAELAALTWHSTAVQAARIALQAEAGQLVIGHFSARYYDLQELLDEACEIFPRTILAEEGVAVRLPLVRTGAPNP